MVFTTRNLTAILAFGLAVTSMSCSNKVSQASSLDPRFQSSDSVSFVQDGVSVSSIDGTVSTLASGLTVSLGLTINPPVPSATGGVQVYASDLKVYGNKVIAGYNVPGNTQRGWVDFIDVTTLAVPLLVGSQYFADTDINSIAMASGKLALVGAKENVGPVLRTGTFNGLGITISATETALTSYAGTGVTFDNTGTKLGITSGDTGAVSILNATTLADVSTAPTSVTDARGITYHAGQGKFFSIQGGTNAKVNSFLGSTGAPSTTSLAIGNATIAQSKGTIVAGTEFLLATLGDGGFAVICASDSKVASSQAQYVYPNYAAAGLPGPTLTVSNAAAFGPGMIFVAAGQAGVRVYNFVTKSGTSPTACQNVQTSYMGYFEFNNTLSANNLVYVNILTTIATYTGILYVADGGGGFKAVTVVGTRSLVNDIIDF